MTLGNGGGVEKRLDALEERLDSHDAHVLVELASQARSLEHLGSIYQTLANRFAVYDREIERTNKDVAQLARDVRLALDRVREPEFSSASLEALVPQMVKAKSPDEVRALFGEMFEQASNKQAAAREKERITRRTRVVEGVVGGLSLTGILELLRWLASLHH